MWITFSLYLIALLLLGALATQRARSRDDFLLAGRRLGPFSAALSSGASSMSGWLLLGLPGKVFQVGLSAVWIAIGCLCGDYLNWKLTAARLRDRAAQLGALTLPEFITGCNEDRLSIITRMLAGAAVVFFMTIYLWAQVVATGKALSGPLGIGLDYPTAILMGSLVIVIYTALGGFLAIVWTDVLQGLMMLVTLVILPIYLLSMVAVQGGWESLMALDTITPAGHARGDWFGGLAAFGIAAMLMSNFGVGAAYLGQPQLAARFMALKSAREAAVARRISVTWTALTATGACTLALCAPALLDTAPQDPEQVILALSKQYLHPWVAGIVIASILAAIMSSADSFLIAAVSSIQLDFPGNLRNAAQSPWVSRLIILILGVIATLLGWATDPSNPDRSVLALVHYAWAGLSITLAVPLLYNLLAARPKISVVLLTIVGGLGLMIVWNVTHLADKVYEVIPCLSFQLLICAAAHRFLSPTAS